MKDRATSGLLDGNGYLHYPPPDNRMIDNREEDLNRQAT